MIPVTANTLPVIPMPKSVQGGKETLSFVPAFFTDVAEFFPVGTTFTEYVRKVHGLKLATAPGGIVLFRDPMLEATSYHIDADANGIVVSASDAEGARYALATVLQLMTVTPDGPQFPQLRIDDMPDCDYRSLMVDLARQWHPFETLFHYVDLCWFYKIKYLHLHFFDTQSYTLPSDRFPKLPTENRHYTKEQIAQLNDYAFRHGVELIPEIEIPGHAAAMVNAYPELFACTPLEESFEEIDPTAFKSPFKNDIICVGKPGILDSLRALIEEVTAMFPHSHYLHMGGDEAAINEWSHCADCVAYMKEHDLPNVRALYTRFTKLVTDMALEMGYTPILWEGFPKECAEEISRDVIVFAWESYYHLAPDLVAEGFQIINCSWQPLYIVPYRRWQPEDILAWNLYNWQHWWDGSEAYLNPIHLQPTKQVIGAQLCAWECNYDQEITAIKENLAALSERIWNIRRYLSDNAFRTKLDALLPLADRLF